MPENTTAAPSGVFKYLDCSTGHITHQTMLMLEEGGNNKLGITIAPYEYGAFVSVPPFGEDDEDRLSRFPADLLAVMRFAAGHGCLIIRFDESGYDYDELPTYDW